MQLQTDGTGVDLFVQCIRQRCIAFAQKTQVHGKRISGLQHALQIPRPRCASGGKRAGGRARAATQHGGHTTGQGFFNLLRRDEMDVGVNRTGGDDHAFARNDFCARPDDDVHTGLGVGVACFSYRSNA